MTALGRKQGRGIPVSRPLRHNLEPLPLPSSNQLTNSREGPDPAQPRDVPYIRAAGGNRFLQIKCARLVGSIRQMETFVCHIVRLKNDTVSTCAAGFTVRAVTLIVLVARAAWVATGHPLLRRSHDLFMNSFDTFSRDSIGSCLLYTSDAADE